MIIEIDKRYNLITNWEDLGYKRCADLDDYIKSLPEWVKMMLMDEEPPEGSPVDPLKMFEVYAKCLEILSDIPYDVLSHVAFMDLLPTFDFIRALVVSMLGNVYVDLHDIDGFVYDNEYYALPVSDTDITGAVVPCAEITALEFCEASDLHQAGYRYAGNIVSILCHKTGEKYDEKICKERGKWDIKMPIVFEVLQKLTSVHEYAKKLYPNIYKAGKGKASAINNFGWMGKILWLGGVENKEKIEQMNVYEFIRLLSFKLAENE